MNMTPLKAAEATRLKLREAGYSPIPVEGKIPRFNEWEKLAGATEEDITSWTVTRPTFTNTGGLTARMPTVDIDIKNPEAAEAAEQLVRDRFGDTGRVLVRVGNAPKRAIPFQTAKPFPKISVNFVSSDGKTDQKIEFLCNGQQVVVDGVHPDTHRPYTWFGGIPGEVRLVDLPCINEAEAKTLVRDLAELLVAEHGYKLAPSRPKTANGANSHNGADQAIEIRGDDWSHLVGNILDGAELHDSLRDLAAKLVTAGVGGGAAVNIVRGVMSRSQAPRDERYHDRFAEIPRLVSSAEQKFAGPHITNNGEFRAPWTPETENSSPPFEENITAAFTVVGDAPAAPPRELIKGLLPAYGIAVTGGQSTAGKTFIQIHKSICLATGLPYFGHRIVERVGTAFVAAEGRALIPNRFAAGLAKALITDRLPIAWIKQLPDFSSTEGIKIFVRQLKALDERFRGRFWREAGTPSH
jgi:AAA domain/Bifunctional DNA primase/polymerase, N-terminal